MASQAGCWALLLTLAGAACGGGAGIAPRPDLPKATETGDAFEGGVKCSSVRAQTEPDLMAWDPGSRANLATLRRQGVVAVRYKAEGCNVELEVLSNCIGSAGKYSYAPYAATDTKIARNNQELYAELPIGAARLGGKLKGGRALRTDYLLVGMASLPIGSTYLASDLHGPDCERATHVVSRVYLGGFAMAAGEAGSLEAAASVFSAKAGGSTSEAVEHVAHEGIAEACETAQNEGTENAKCAVPLRVGLLPINGRAEGGCPPGSTFDGKQCVQRKVVTEVDCPPGSVAEQGRCVARVSDTCPNPGLHFEAGRGCVPNLPAPSTASPPAPTVAAPSTVAPRASGPNPPGRRPSDIAAVVAAHRTEARACYDKLSTGKVPQPQGDLVLHFVIDAAGVVVEVTFDRAASQIQDDAIVGCVSNAVKRIRFASSAEGFETRAKYPFNFQPRTFAP
jgi:hypothetical protein